MTVDKNTLTITDKIAVFVSSMFYIGYLPKMPGTYGTFVAIIFYYLFPDKLTFIFVMMSLLALGTWLSHVIEKKFGNDPSFIVIDEVVGMMIPLIVLHHSILLLIVAFILFRLFDIFKPLGIDNLQSLPYGFGVMMDDVLAGIYTLMCILLLLKL